MPDPKRSPAWRPTDDRMLSPAELAAYLGVPLSTVYRWNYSGDAPPRLRIGKHIRYRQSAVDVWLDAQQATTPA